MKIIRDINFIILKMSFQGQYKYQKTIIFLYLHISCKYEQHLKLIVENGGLTFLIQLLESPYLRIANQAVWVISNLIEKDIQYQKIALQQNIIPQLIKLIQMNKNIYNLTIAISTLNIVCENFNFYQTNHIGQEISKSIINILCQQLKFGWEKLIQLCLEGLMRIVGNSEILHQYMMDQGFISSFIPLIMSDDINISQSILQIFYYLTQDKNVIDYVLQKDFLATILILLRKDNNMFKIYLISNILENIASGSQQQLHYLINNKQVMKEFLNLLRVQEIDREITDLILSFLRSITKSANEEDIRFLIDQGLCETLLQCKNLLNIYNLK